MNRAAIIAYCFAILCSSAHAQIDSNADTPNSESGLQASDWFDSFESGSCQSGNCESETCRRIFDQKYCSFFGGFTDLDNFERILRPPTGRIFDGAKTGAGFSAGVAFGGVIRDFVRNEIELTYRDNSVSSVFNQEFDTTGLLVASATAPASGSINSYSGIYNVLLDVGKRCEGMPHLYVGGGLGSVYVDGDFATATDAYTVHDPSFAYQFIGGLNYPMRKSVDVYTEYRYLGADNISVTNDTVGVGLGDFTFDSHSVYFGVRFRGFR